MKRCPQCNRLETDDVLTFCRADGTRLINDSLSLGREAGTAKFSPASEVSEIETSILPHTTDAAASRSTSLRRKAFAGKDTLDSLHNIVHAPAP